MAKSFYKLPAKEINAAVADLVDGGVLTETEYGYILHDDLNLLERECFCQAKTSGEHACVFALHRNDFLVKSNEHNLRGREWLKERYTHSYSDTLYYVLIDGEFRGAVAGHFRNGPNNVEDILLDIPPDEAAERKDEILQAIHYLCGANNKIKRFQGEELQ